MAGGFFSGFIFGTVASGAVLAALSILTSIPVQKAPEALVSGVSTETEFDQGVNDDPVTLPDTQAEPEQASVTDITEPETPADTDNLNGLQDADTTAAQEPVTGGTQTTLIAPDDIETDTGINVAGDAAVQSVLQVQAPDVPQEEDPLSVSTEPALPVQPEVGTDEIAITLPIEGDSQTEEEQVTDGSTIGNLAPDVATDRLPSIGDPPEISDDTIVANGFADLPPLEAFAQPFENPDNKPLMSVILIDDGQSGVSLSALSEFPYPVSFAVNAADPNAAETAAKIRRAGREVLIQADLPRDATPADVETAMQVYLAAVPEAVAVIEGTDTGLQSSRQAGVQLGPILLESGHGLVLFSNGLNTVQKLITRQGVPSMTVFRDFDAQGQTSTTIRRFLDQAAFKAGQETTGVVMVGRLRAETVNALLLWGLQDRVGRVTLAPISALLKQE